MSHSINRNEPNRTRFFLHKAFILLITVGTTIAACERGEPGATTIKSEHPKTTTESMTVVTYGAGAYQDSHKKAFIEPFIAETGIKMESVSWSAQYGRLQEMVASGKVPWDVVEVTAAQYSRGMRDGLFERLGSRSELRSFEPFSPGLPVTEFGVPNVYWSTVLAYEPKLFTTRSPESWRDFWDTTRFPGHRALYDDPRGNLEFALLADGVPIDKVYPLDVDRAFRKFDEIKSFIRVWWKDGTEPVQLLLTGQVAMTSAWSGRIFASSQAREQLRYTWSGGLHELDYWVIPKGSKNVSAATDFIAFASRPDRMAEQANLRAYGPANRRAIQFVDPAVLPHLPTNEENWSKSFVIDSEWWASNEQKVQERWLLWKNQ